MYNVIISTYRYGRIEDFNIGDIYLKLEPYGGEYYIVKSLHDPLEFTYEDVRMINFYDDYMSGKIKESKLIEKKQEYFVDFYKDKYGEHEVQVEAMWDKNGKELYNGAKAIYHANWGDEIGKIKIYQDITSDDKYVYSYGFKPKKGSALYIYDANDVELI